MNELIKVAEQAIGGEPVQAVNARDLHAFLEVGKDFSTWIKSRIEQYDFMESQDFAVFEAAPQNGGAGNRGVRVEYALTLDMAKELAMVERTPRGKQARQYFIECERRAKAVPQIGGDMIPRAALYDPVRLRELLLDFAEEKQELEQNNRMLQAANATMQPKVEALERIAEADCSMTMTDAAKQLQMRPKDLIAWLSQHHWIYRRSGSEAWTAYQERIERGLLEHKVTTVEREDGTEKVVTQARVTAKGLARLAEEVSGRAAA